MKNIIAFVLLVFVLGACQVKPKKKSPEEIKIDNELTPKLLGEWELFSVGKDTMLPVNKTTLILQKKGTAETRLGKKKKYGIWYLSKMGKVLVVGNATLKNELEILKIEENKLTLNQKKENKTVQVIYKRAE